MKCFRKTWKVLIIVNSYLLLLISVIILVFSKFVSVFFRHVFHLQFYSNVDAFFCMYSHQISIFDDNIFSVFDVGF